MQVESSGGSTVAGGGIGAGVDAMYPTPLPILTPIKVFQDANGNLLNVSELNSHTAVIGRSGEGKTHLTCHLIMQWEPIKGWNHGWVMAIMPRSVRAPTHALLTSPLHNMRSHHPLHNMRSPHPCTTCAHVWDDDEKVCCCPRCREEIPSDDVGDACSDNESDNDDYDPGADGGNRRKRAETSA